MPRKAKKPRTYNLASKVRSALRRVWQWSPQRREALARARVAYGRYRCAACSRDVGPRDISVDHITPCGTLNPDLSNLTEFAIRMMFGELQGLCDSCHQTTTNEERRARKSAR